MSRKISAIASAARPMGEPMVQEPFGSVRERSDRLRPRQDIPCPGNAFVTRVRLVDGRVDEAWSTGRMMRNMNALLRGGLDAQGRPQFAHQAHCLCNDGHALAAIRALEDLAGVVPPPGALLARNIVQALRCIQEHLLHVYQFHLSDWASLESALRADPARAARLARLPQQDAGYFRRAQDRFRALAGEREADAAGGNFGGHPDYCGPDALHLLLHANSLESLRTGSMLNTALNLLGCGPEGFRAYQLGGIAEDMDLGAGVLDQLRGLLAECLSFVRNVFLTDVERLGQAYAHWAKLGAGSTFLAWGDFDCHQEDGPLFPGGIIVPGSPKQCGHGLWATRPPSLEKIREEREPEWSEENRRRYRLRPGDDDPSFLWGKGEFFWLPAPRHGGDACEVGPLARIMGGWTLGRTGVSRAISKTINTCGLTPATMNSTLGRVLSRGIESSLLAQAALEWLDDLEALSVGGPAAMRTDLILPASGVGAGRMEAPRGTLIHTIRLEKNRIADHDYLIPSLWNFSPRDSQGGRGPLERALLGVPVADPDHPLELLRTVHELDPCNACLIVIEDCSAGRTIVANAK